MKCPDCGGRVVMVEGCELCINCGWTPCYSARPPGRSQPANLTFPPEVELR